MLFSSPAFLFGFLPMFLAVYYAAGRFRNLVLFLASMAFYFTSSGALSVILLLSVVVNWALARPMSNAQGGARHAWLTAGVLVNILPLLYYKYAHFLLGILSPGLAGRLGDTPLPIGISFYSFQAVSYLADVASRRVPPARSLVDFGMYHACFPQLIAGPIVRYEEIAREVAHRRVCLDDVHGGIVRFCFGLGKKVLLADPTGRIADAVFQVHDGQRGWIAAWIGMTAYTLQIYFDFSGYSDMAIGLGRMLGFPYPENFDQPYRSRSVTEFWRRWHMTLSRWFRDYLYIPLGGNRHGLIRTLLNLVAVFFLCGLWHGAAYTFVAWGLLHGALLVGERAGRQLTTWRPPWLLGWAYTMLAVMLAWVVFRADSLRSAAAYITELVTPAGPGLPAALWSTLTPDKLCSMAAAIVLALAPLRRAAALAGRQVYFGPAKSAASLLVAVLSIVTMSGYGFSPFIYFRF